MAPVWGGARGGEDWGEAGEASFSAATAGVQALPCTASSRLPARPAPRLPPPGPALPPAPQFTAASLPSLLPSRQGCPFLSAAHLSFYLRSPARALFLVGLCCSSSQEGPWHREGPAHLRSRLPGPREQQLWDTVYPNGHS